MLAHELERARESVVGWLASEKLDGIRAWWDGTNMMTSGGNTIVAPAWWLARLPNNIVLDGELWLGRGRFSECSGAARRQTVKDEAIWKEMKFMVFDAPEHPGGYEERLEHACRTLDNYFVQSDTVKIVGYVAVDDMDHLMRMHDQIVANGGEGLMVRKPGSLYEKDRSYNLLKVKKFHDAEAVVTAHKAGKGKHTGRLGALVVQKEGVEFDVGTGFSDEQRDKAAELFPIGTVITFGYFELDAKTMRPRFPTFIRVRHDE